MYVLYQVAGEHALRFSLAFEVDREWWRSRGRETAFAASVSSAAAAFGRIRQGGGLPPAAEGEEPFAGKGNPDLEETARLAKRWKRLLAGRALLPAEVTALLASAGQAVSSRIVRQVLQYLVLEGNCRVLPAVESGGSGGRGCRRCGSAEAVRESRCAWCGDRCALCEHCLLLGRARSCLPLFLFADEEPRIPRASPIRPARLRLTPAQAAAAGELEALVQGGSRRILFWAVTGAGKTETMMPLLGRMLTEGKRVLWVTPRKDVVHELAPRLRSAFPEARVRALCGGSRDLWKEGELFVSTAHQAMRFSGRFDLAVADEADAFPLYGNPSLEGAVLRALRPEAPLILLTATPPAGWRSLVRQERLPAVILPVRHHGAPLPEPELVRVGHLRNRLLGQKALPAFSAFLRRVEETDGQAFVFVPAIEDVAAVLRWLKAREPRWSSLADGVFSRDRRREEKVEKFRNGALRLLVTTTILERGVTVPRAHALVLCADHPVFDRAALVQIAGRVGRSAEYRKGTVVYLAAERTEAQVQAKKEIRRLNLREAGEGFPEERKYKH